MPRHRTNTSPNLTPPRRGRPGRPGHYDHPVDYLPGATAFSAYPEMQRPLWFIRTFRNEEDLTELLVEKTNCSREGGRTRNPVQWGLLYLAYVLSTMPSLRKFWNLVDEQVWAECGLSCRPPLSTLSLRFEELEQCADDLLDVVGVLIGRAKQRDFRVGLWVDVDGTGAQTPSRVEHVCLNRAACNAAGGSKTKFMPRLPQEMVNEIRHAEAENPLPEDGRQREGRDTWISGKHRYWRVDGHVYRCKDTTAGLRKFGNFSWCGSNKLSATDRFTGGRLVDNVIEAGTQEWNGYPELIERVHRVLGEWPRGVCADRGFAVASVFEFNTRHKIASAISWRKTSGLRMEREDEDTDLFDRHGIPRCRHCGAPGTMRAAGLGLYFERDEPRLRFRCSNPHTPECRAQRQSIACEERWAILVPLDRLHPTYYKLARGKPAERTHRLTRERYGAAGSDTTGRLRRRGIDAQRLRCSASLIIEWFRILIIQGWLHPGDRPLNTNEAEHCTPGTRLEKVKQARKDSGLDLPYGPAAFELGLAPTADLPSATTKRLREERKTERQRKAAERKAAKREAEEAENIERAEGVIAEDAAMDSAGATDVLTEVEDLIAAAAELGIDPEAIQADAPSKEGS